MPILSIEFVKYHLLKKASELLSVDNANLVYKIDHKCYQLKKTTEQLSIFLFINRSMWTTEERIRCHYQKALKVLSKIPFHI